MSTSAPQIHDPLQFYCGDTWEISCACHQSDGSVLDLSDAEVEWKLADLNTREVLITKTLGAGVTVVGDLSAGIVEVVVDATASKQLPPGFYYDQIRVTFQLSGIVTTQVGGRIQALQTL